ncbi:Uncharacterized protein Adt_21522 [Abeliophyllum distichum]|uniref:Uncharacterized protein n=1 Tax=Abeliophyllum distichum TaxID=126358 RepID=A0ABD1SZU5_9LAMI
MEMDVLDEQKLGDKDINKEDRKNHMSIITSGGNSGIEGAMMATMVATTAATGGTTKDISGMANYQGPTLEISKACFKLLAAKLGLVKARKKPRQTRIFIKAQPEFIGKKK